MGKSFIAALGSIALWAASYMFNLAAEQRPEMPILATAAQLCAIGALLGIGVVIYLAPSKDDE